MKGVGAMKHITTVAVGMMLYVALAGTQAGAQNQEPTDPQTQSSGPSLGAYARQVRKGPDSSSKPKVFDNDNLPKTDKLSVVGTPTPLPTTASAADANAQPASNAAVAPADSKNGNESKPVTPDKTGASTSSKAPEDEATKLAAWKQWGDKMKAQQQQIDLLSRELDVLQREYQIRAAAMYADAGNRLRNAGDWDKQDAQYKQQIADKQKAVDEAKQKLEELQENARKAGAPTSVQEQ